MFVIFTTKQYLIKRYDRHDFGWVLTHFKVLLIESFQNAIKAANNYLNRKHR